MSRRMNSTLISPISCCVTALSNIARGRPASRAVETVDFMTARWADLPYEFLDLVARRIINEVAGISRVTYDISGKPPATIEWE